MKNIRIISLALMVLFMSFKASCPISQQNTYSYIDYSATIRIIGNNLKCRTVLIIKGKIHTKVHDMELSKITEFGFVSKAGQRIEIKVFNY